MDKDNLVLLDVLYPHIVAFAFLSYNNANLAVVSGAKLALWHRCLQVELHLVPFIEILEISCQAYLAFFPGALAKLIS